MRHCINEQAQFYEAVGDSLPNLLRDAAATLDSLDGDYAWADLNVGTHFGDRDYEGAYSLSMTVH